ncbi:hypothetical protein MWX50_003883, partial [Morganella morganii]
PVTRLTRTFVLQLISVHRGEGVLSYCGVSWSDESANAVPTGSHRAEHNEDDAASASLSLFCGDRQGNSRLGCT